MDAERTAVTCSGRRVVAKKRHHGGILKKLQKREIISSKRDHGCKFAEDRFRNIQLQEEYDTYDPEEDFPLSLPFRNRRTTMIDVFATSDVVFALAQFGLCAAFSRETKKRICFLNVNPDEVIQSMFYNEKNDSLITTSILHSDSVSSFICRSTSIESIRRGGPHATFRLFESESINWPGFVEFDDVNGKVIMHCFEDKIYKVFDLKSYKLLYSIFDNKIQEIRISPGILLLLYEGTRRGIPLRIVSVEDGTILKSLNLQIHEGMKMVFIELFNEKLLVKQEDENLKIVDVENSEVIEVSETEFLNPSAFKFLYHSQSFLALANQTATLWNLRGELVTSFKDHVLWHPYYNTDTVYVSNNEDLVIAYCKADADEPSSGGMSIFARKAGSIYISNTLTGKCVQQITPSNSINRTRASKIRNTVEEALEGITFLSYNEERNEIFTANKHGRVHVWTN